MKRLGKQTDANTLCVLHASDANMSRTGYFQEYIAFGNWVDSCDGPSIRFHGGSPFSGRLDNAPVMCFNIYGDCKIVPAMWMNENNCPNVYDDKFINQITTFIQINLPILYLVYNRFLDKEDALAYFKGTIDWCAMLSSVYRFPNEVYTGLFACENNAQLHEFCVLEGLYGKQEIISDRSILCAKLEGMVHPIFETTCYGDEFVLLKYNGCEETVNIPEGVDRIGSEAFSGHKEIRKIVFPDTVQTIDKRAFSGCCGIEMLLLPPSIWDVCEDAFSECTRLQTVCFEAQQTHDLYLSKDAFRGCISLTEIILPQDVIPEGNPFGACPNLRKIAIHDTPGYTRDGFAINAIVYSDVLWVGCNGTAVPNGTKEIDTGAFADCPDLKELFIPNSVVKIHRESFLQCPNLVIHCNAGSCAEHYAIENNIPYHCVNYADVKEKD